jgi:trehalose-phosphatase
LKIPPLLGDASLKAIERLTVASGQILIALDYDGTLVPIVEDPTDAVLSDSARETLRRLAKRPQTCVAIVTSRTLAEIRRLVKVPEITFAALNGLVIFTNGETENHDDLPRAERIMERVREELDGKLREWSGLRVEDRGVALALHHGHLTKKDADAIAERAAGLLEDERVQILRGKKVIEVLPDVAWDKGVAVRRFMEMHRTLGTLPLLVCAGDEPIDTPALKMARDLGGVAIGVGSEAARSGNYLAKDSEEIVQFLERLDGWLAGRPAAA